DSKKSGGITRSHLRFGKKPIQSEYLATNANFIACHNQAFIGRFDILEGIKDGGVFLLNSNWKQDEAFYHLTEDMQKTIVEKKIKFYNIDALKIATEVGLGGRINTVMQTAFFLISGVLERDTAIEMIKNAIKKTFFKKGEAIIKMNWKAVDSTNEALQEISNLPALPCKHVELTKLVPDNADEFTRNVIEKIMREKGDEIPVSHMPYDGFIPSGTTKLEKRGVAPMVPRWIAEKCIQCNQCSLICPHSAVRSKLIERPLLTGKPEQFTTLKAMGKDGETHDYKIQIYPEDCQSCWNCVNACPKDALEMVPIAEEREAGENENVSFFENLPEDVLSSVVGVNTVKGSQFKQPLLEFSGACAGCGETPYVKLITQLFGDRMIVANATGCTSIWGGTFPTIPYTKNKHGYGPSWANSLFEDNAEYGFGMRLAVDSNRKQLKYNVEKALTLGVSGEIKAALETGMKLFNSVEEDAKANSREIQKLLPTAINAASGELITVLKRVKELDSYFVDKSIWCFGGDGWAYDIGFGGLDHVMASGKNVNILVVDTEVYSNTGGQASKATPLGSVAKFAEAGKNTNKKDLAAMMMSYGYVYVASVSMGSNRNQLVKAMKEAEEYNGPSIVIAYAPCINHGCDMKDTQLEEKLAVDSGYWLLYRFNPRREEEGKNPFILDSREPKMEFVEFLKREKRYTSLRQTFPDRVDAFWKKAAEVAKQRYEKYKKMAE
ncbi:MAG: pyruvate:ferredoxin (flavodoxin) oxidoreductase, partial [Candidatus Cloacimonetes bacterium]|nr:pyruvate:ferredoxin (flavodoxin) oxidoreductase [Candidatus Cloacimonadota bacterium]